jgi:hypothetical protein
MLFNCKAKTLYEALSVYGHDEDFEPLNFSSSPEYHGTKYGPGSLEKIEVMRRRVEVGLPLWHQDDAKVCSRTSSDKPQREKSDCGITKVFPMHKKSIAE